MDLALKKTSILKLHLPTFILPLLVLSVTFSSKPLYPDVWLNQIISSGFILCAIVLFYRTCRIDILALGIPIAVIFLRLMRFRYGEEVRMVEIIYFVPYSILLLGVGAKMVRDYPLLMLRQIKWICVISVTLSLLQIMGVQWAQSLTNFYWYKGGSTWSYLFVWWENLPPVSGIQERPVGFTSSNNVLSQFLLFFYAFCMWWFANKKNRDELSSRWLFSISFACALTGSKLVLVGSLLLSVFAMLIVKEERNFYLFRVIPTVLLAYMVYFLFFPGLFVYNFNLDLFAFNSMIRLEHLRSLASIPYADNIFQFLSKFNTGYYIGQRDVLSTLARFSERAEDMTGLGIVIRYIPFLMFAGLLIGPLWITLLRKMQSGLFDIQKVAPIMLVASVVSSAGGPFLFTSYFWFFFSFAMFPLSVLLLKNQTKKTQDLPNFSTYSPRSFP